MWEVFTESNVPVLKNERGFAIQRIRISRELCEEYLCTGDFGKFEFGCCRWDEKSQKPKDTYTVFLGQINPESETNQCIIRYAKEIEDALMKYPLHHFWEGISIKEVFFLKSQRDKAILLKADELLSGEHGK